MIEESLNEFAKRGRPRKGVGRPRKNLRGIEASDAWGEVEDDEVVNPDDFEVDTSDMEDVEEIEIEDDAFDDKLLKVLTYETQVPEYARGALKFRLKNDDAQIYWGIPMVKMGDNAFLFKLENGQLKKILLRDIILVEGERSSHRARMVINENNDLPENIEDYYDNYDEFYDEDDEFYYDGYEDDYEEDNENVDYYLDD